MTFFGVNMFCKVQVEVKEELYKSARHAREMSVFEILTSRSAKREPTLDLKYFVHRRARANARLI